MKKLLLSFLLFSMGLVVSSQSLSLSYDDNPIAPYGTIQIVCNPDSGVVSGYIACTNNSTSTLSIRTKKIINEGDTLPGTVNYFCWGACFAEQTYVSPTVLDIAPGETSTDFYADYDPMHVPGISTITYVFFDDNNHDDSVAVTVQWNGGWAGISDELLDKVSFSDAYPNPASTLAHINYDLPSGMENSSVIVTNLLGAKVMEFPVNDLQGRLEIPVFDLLDGVYFYTLKSHNEIAITKKLIVRH